MIDFFEFYKENAIVFTKGLLQELENSHLKIKELTTVREVLMGKMQKAMMEMKLLFEKMNANNLKMNDGSIDAVAKSIKVSAEGDIASVDAYRNGFKDANSCGSLIPINDSLKDDLNDLSKLIVDRKKAEESNLNAEDSLIVTGSTTQQTQVSQKLHGMGSTIQELMTVTAGADMKALLDVHQYDMPDANHVCQRKCITAIESMVAHENDFHDKTCVSIAGCQQKITKFRRNDLKLYTSTGEYLMTTHSRTALMILDFQEEHPVRGPLTLD